MRPLNFSSAAVWTDAGSAPSAGPSAVLQHFGEIAAASIEAAGPRGWRNCWGGASVDSCHMPACAHRLSLGLGRVGAPRMDLGRIADREWLKEGDAPHGISHQAANGEARRPHLEARLAAAMASDAFE